MLKQQFKVALALAGMTQAHWAKKYGVSEPCLSKLLSGKMSSKKTTAKINAFIVREFTDKKFLLSKRISSKNNKTDVRKVSSAA